MTRNPRLPWSRSGGARHWCMAVLLSTAAACANAGDSGRTSPDAPNVCSDEWYQMIESKLPTGDGREHGPDIGSDEWKSVIEYKLGIRNSPNLPLHQGVAWCRYIDQIVMGRRASSRNAADSDEGATARGPSYACDKVRRGSIEAIICKDAVLSALDRDLSRVYSAASRKAKNEHPPVLRAEQRGWIKGRNECWKSGDKRRCVLDAYQRRIAELQARYQLVPGKGPVRFICEGNPANEVVTTFFRTTPPTLIAERGDSVSLMYLQPSGSGSKYRGRNEIFWEHLGEALITWGYGAPAMRCTKAP